MILNLKLKELIGQTLFVIDNVNSQRVKASKLQCNHNNCINDN